MHFLPWQIQHIPNAHNHRHTNSPFCRCIRLIKTKQTRHFDGFTEHYAQQTPMNSERVKKITFWRLISDCEPFHLEKKIKMTFKITFIIYLFIQNGFFQSFLTVCISSQTINSLEMRKVDSLLLLLAPIFWKMCALMLSTVKSAICDVTKGTDSSIGG